MTMNSCGYKPLYGHKKGEVNVTQELKQVFVANMGGGRFGQVLRETLQKEMSSDSREKPNEYVLRATGSLEYEYLDIHEDNTAGRVRAVGKGRWILFDTNSPQKKLAEGYTSTLDGFNPSIDQTFSQSLNTETLSENVAQALAHDMTQQVAIWFKSHRAPGVYKKEEKLNYLNMDNLSSGPGRLDKIGADGFPAAATGRTSGSMATSSDIGMADPNIDPNATTDIRNDSNATSNIDYSNKAQKKQVNKKIKKENKIKRHSDNIIKKSNAHSSKHNSKDIYDASDADKVTHAVEIENTQIDKKSYLEKTDKNIFNKTNQNYQIGDDGLPVNDLK